MFPPGDERNEPEHWVTRGNKEQRRRARAVLGRGTKSDRDRAFRSKMKKKYDELGIVAIVGGESGRPNDDKLRDRVRLAIERVQGINQQPKRSDFKAEIESQLRKTISQATLTRYLDKNFFKKRKQ
jgi:hypothetical protein